MRILVIGSSGFLGRCFTETLPAANTFALQRLNSESSQFILSTQMSVTHLKKNTLDKVFLQAILLAKPEVVINCIALTSAEKCENNPNEAYFVNAEIPFMLAKITSQLNMKIIQISTDAVFGQTGSSFSLTDKPVPRSIYGKSKLLGEINVLQANLEHLIVRTNFFGNSLGRKTLFDYFYDRLVINEYAIGFTNQIFSPMYIEDLVLNLIRAIKLGVGGTIHMGGKDIITKFNFGVEIARQLGVDQKFIVAEEYQNSPNKPFRNLNISLDSVSSEKIIRDNSDLENGIKRAISSREKMKYD